MGRCKVLSEGNPKTRKGEKRGWLTGILHFLPHRYAGIGNLCPDASPGCVSTCLVFAGRGQMKKIQSQRMAKTIRFRDDRDVFMLDLAWNIKALIRKSIREERNLVIRLNGTSDIPWENVKVANQGYTLMELFPTVQFYDYTKSRRRMEQFLGGKMPPNYHLTFSLSENNKSDAIHFLALGAQVAAVVDTVPEDLDDLTLFGFPVHSGESDDLRFLDPSGIFLLKAKGLAKKDTSGFVLRGVKYGRKKEEYTGIGYGPAGRREEGADREVHSTPDAVLQS